MSASNAIPALSPSHGAGAWRRVAMMIGVVTLVASLLGFGWTLGGHFLGDDFGYIGRFYSYPLLRWPHLFAESWAGDMWGFQLRELRPVTALSFITEARIWGGQAWGYRVTNLLLHAGCGTMVGLLAWRAAGRDLACGIGAAILFALHPAHAEPVQWITGRVDVLATTFYLAGFLVFLRFRANGGTRNAVTSAGLYALAAFSKEFGLTLPIMFLFADLVWLQTWRRWSARETWMPYFGSGAVAVIYFFCRRAAFGPGGVGAAVPSLLNIDFQRQLAQRQLTYFGHLFPPSERWLSEGAPLLKDPALRTFTIIAAVVLVLFALWRWAARFRPAEERRAGLFFGLGWYLVATLPLVVTYISPRHLYLASAGVCVAVALIVRGLVRMRWIYGVVVVGVAALFVQHLRTTMRPWHTAAVLSGQVSRELRSLEPIAKDGGALFLDVPEIRDGAYVWTWAVPFALRPPFTRGPLADRVVVLESRGLYVDWDRWHEQPAVEALRHVQVESWIVQLLGDQPMKRIPVPAEKVRSAAEHFLAEPRQKFPHESWRKLINEMTGK